MFINKSLMSKWIEVFWTEEIGAGQKVYSCVSDCMSKVAFFEEDHR